MNAFFDFLKWSIKVSLAASAILIALIAAFIIGRRNKA